MLRPRRRMRRRGVPPPTAARWLESWWRVRRQGLPDIARHSPPSTRSDPFYFRNLGIQCASPGFRDSPAQPTDHFQGLELFNPRNWPT